MFSFLSGYHPASTYDVAPLSPPPPLLSSKETDERSRDVHSYSVFAHRYPQQRKTPSHGRFMIHRQSYKLPSPLVSLSVFIPKATRHHNPFPPAPFGSIGSDRPTDSTRPILSSSSSSSSYYRAVRPPATRHQLPSTTSTPVHQRTQTTCNLRLAPSILSKEKKVTDFGRYPIPTSAQPCNYR